MKYATAARRVQREYRQTILDRWMDQLYGVEAPNGWRYLSMLREVLEGLQLSGPH